MRTDQEFVLTNVFNHVPSGTFTAGPFEGQEYKEFWWRETVEEDGYVLVWLGPNDEIECHHTYHHPENLYI